MWVDTHFVRKIKIFVLNEFTTISLRRNILQNMFIIAVYPPARAQRKSFVFQDEKKFLSFIYFQLIQFTSVINVFH